MTILDRAAFESMLSELSPDTLERVTVDADKHVGHYVCGWRFYPRENAEKRIGDFLDTIAYMRKEHLI